MTEKRPKVWYDDEQIDEEMRQDDFPFGLWHGFVQADTLLATSGAPVVALSLTTPSLPAGDYKISWTAIYDTSNNSGAALVSVEVDSAVTWSASLGAGVSNQDTLVGFSVESLAAGVHTFELILAQSGPGTADLIDRCLTIERFESG